MNSNYRCKYGCANIGPIHSYKFSFCSKTKEEEEKKPLRNSFTCYKFIIIRELVFLIRRFFYYFAQYIMSYGNIASEVFSRWMMKSSFSELFRSSVRDQSIKLLFCVCVLWILYYILEVR